VQWQPRAPQQDLARLALEVSQAQTPPAPETNPKSVY
jgi:hypothetical protein